MLAVVTTDQRGSIAELAITMAAMRLGVTVLKPVSERQRYDLAFDLGNRFVRIQCKSAGCRNSVVVVRCRSGRRTRNGVVMRRYTADEIDAFAVYCIELDRCYLLPMEIFAGRATVHLRLRPARNHQRALIHPAEHFEFAATLTRLKGP
jgi:PD-(D/E)XK nuclease superfamily protein